MSSSRSMSYQSSWLATGFPLAVFQSRFFQLFIQAGPSFVSLTDLITYWEFKTNSKGCLGQTQLFQLLQAFQKSSHFHFVIGGAQTAGTISKLLAIMLDHVGPNSLIAVLDMAALARAGAACGRHPRYK